MSTETLTESVAHLKSCERKSGVTLNQSMMTVQAFSRNIKAKKRMFQRWHLSVHPEKVVEHLHNQLTLISQ